MFNNLNKNSIASIKFLIASLVVMTVFIFGFVFLLRSSERHVSVVDFTDYILMEPDNFAYEIIVDNQEQAIGISGYALVLEEEPFYVDNHIVLYSEQNDVYLKAPTSMQFDLDIELPEDVGAYYYGKYTSIVLKEDLELDLAEYKIGFLYKSNGYNNLILTEQTIQ